MIWGYLHDLGNLRIQTWYIHDMQTSAKIYARWVLFFQNTISIYIKHTNTPMNIMNQVICIYNGYIIFLKFISSATFSLFSFRRWSRPEHHGGLLVGAARDFHRLRRQPPCHAAGHGLSPGTCAPQPGLAGTAAIRGGDLRLCQHRHWAETCHGFTHSSGKRRNNGWLKEQQKISKAGVWDSWDIVLWMYIVYHL